MTSSTYQIAILLKLPNREDLRSFTFLKSASWNARVWQAALGSLCNLTARCGGVEGSRLSKMSLKVIASFLEASKRNGWSEQIHSRLNLLAISLMYTVENEVFGSEKSNGSDSTVSFSSRSTGYWCVEIWK